jgi:predicted MFS family arabinose efflux permease
MTPQQARLVAIGSDRAPLMLSLNASAIYLGVAIGSAIGGASLMAGGWAAAAIAATLVAMLALGHLVLSDRLASR